MSRGAGRPPGEPRSKALPGIVYGTHGTAEAALTALALVFRLLLQFVELVDRLEGRQVGNIKYTFLR